MKRFYTLLCLTTSLFAFPHSALSDEGTPSTSSPAAQLSRVATTTAMAWNSAIPFKDGRFFVQHMQLAHASSPQLGIYDTNGQLSAYPDKEWNKILPANSAKKAPDLLKQFLTLNGMYLKAGTTSLWVLDAGLLNGGKDKPKGAKLVQIDITTNAITRIIPIAENALQKGSVLSQVCIKDNHAYIGDSGVPALLVVDLNKSTTRRLLENHPSLAGNRPLIVNGKSPRALTAYHSFKNINNLALSPDESLLYYAPTTGPLYLIRTQMIDDPSVTPIELNESMMLWYNVPSSSGMAISPEGTLYFSDIAHNSITSLSPDRHLSTVIADPKLQWPGHLFLSGKTLYIPTTQSENIQSDHHGKNEKLAPSSIYKLTVPLDPTSSQPTVP